MKKPTESALVRNCLELLQLRGVFAFRVNTTGIFDPGRNVFRSFQGMCGVSDILGLLDGGRFLAEGTPAEVRDNPIVHQAYLGNRGAREVERA